MHLKRLNTPKRWNIAKKLTTFVARPSPGPHPNSLSLPLIVILREHLKLITTKKEANKIFNGKLLLVDNTVVKDAKLPIGLFDVLSIPSTKSYYRVVMDYKGGLKPLAIKEDESSTKPYSVLNKTRIKSGKIQLNCTSGRNIIVSKGSYKTGDTIMFDLASKKILKHLPAKKDSLVLVINGKHAGEIAKIQDFKDFESVSKDRVILKNEKGVVYETMKDYVFVIGEKDAELKIREEVKK